MGKYKVLSRDSWSNTRKFLVDTENDLNILPKNIGSTALVAETSDEYILNNKKEWVKIKKDSSNNNENNSGNETVNNDNEAIFIEKEDGGQWPDTFPMSMQELTERALSGTLPKVYIKYVTGSSSAKWLAIRECIPSFAFKYGEGNSNDEIYFFAIETNYNNTPVVLPMGRFVLFEVEGQDMLGLEFIADPTY